MKDKLEKAKAYYAQNKVAVWIFCCGLVGLLMVHWVGSSLSELYAVDAVQ